MSTLISIQDPTGTPQPYKNNKVNDSSTTTPTTGPVMNRSLLLIDLQKPTLLKRTTPSLDKGETNTNSAQYKNEISLLDSKELNELISIDVATMTQQAKYNKRKMSDEDVFIEETLIFTYDGTKQQNSPTLTNKKQQQTQPIKSMEQILQNVDELMKKFIICVQVANQNEEDEQQDEQERQQLKQMMNGENPDAEIDKLLETFSMSGQLFSNKNILNGEFIENDIRLNENIRDSIEEIKQIQRQQSTRTSEIEKKKFLGKYMDVAETLGVSLTVEHLLPCLSEIFKQDEGHGQDKGYLRLIYNQLDKLITFLSASEITAGYNGIRDNIMPFLYEFFQTDRIDEQLKTELQNEVIELLVKVTKIMTNEDKAEKVLPIILEIVRDDSDEEKRILGLELIDRIAEQIGKEICQNYLMYEIVSLQDDQVYRVRKETVLRMLNISKVVGNDIFLALLFPVFKKLAADPIWGVRRAAVEMLPAISNLCPEDYKNHQLIELFKKFSNDSSKWVKLATFQYLGPFIASYSSIEPSPILIDYYINMCEQNKGNQADNDIPYHCAFNFPAVLQTLGPKAWTKLQPVHQSLVRDARWKVRRTLAFSLHEIALILGPEQTEKELLSVLYHFFKDINEVREGVLTTLPKFVKVLTISQRESYVDKLVQTSIETQDWRKRIVQAQHIKAFAKLFSAQTVNKYYVPMFFQLCQDQVAEVREEAAKATKNLIVKLIENQQIFDDFKRQIKVFKESNRYNLRQVQLQYQYLFFVYRFVFMCASLFDKEELFIKYLLADFIEVSQDRVPNVRISLSEVVRNHFVKHNKLTTCALLRNIDLCTMINYMSTDQSRDVKTFIQEIILLDPNYQHPKLMNSQQQLEEEKETDQQQQIEQVEDWEDRISIEEYIEEKTQSLLNNIIFELNDDDYYQQE